MRLILTIALAASAAVYAEPAQPGTLVDALIATNAKIETVRCEVRRETEVDGKLGPATLSRVWFQRGNLLRVETLSPQARRIVVDGTHIRKWIAGEPDGVQIPISDAPETEQLEVQRVPASGEEHLLRLRGAPETKLPPQPGFPVRRGYTPPSPRPYVELSQDDKGRLARIEFFDATDHSKRLVRVDFQGWREAKPGIWIACRQKTEVDAGDGTIVNETLRIGRLAVNDPIPETRFVLSPEEENIQFLSVDAMKERLSEK